MMDVMAAASSTAEERGTRCREYLQALEEERRKIEAFQRELPLTLHLVTQAIECYRQQMSAEVFPAGCAVRSKLQEATEEEVACEGAPVLEEFIPIKRSSSSEAGDEEEAGEGRPQRDHHRSSHGGHDDEDSSGTSKQQETSCEKRPDWLRSVQLWSHHPDPRPLPREEEHAMDMNPRRPSVAVEVKKATTGAFLPFHSQKRSPPPAAVEAAAPVPAPTPAVPATSSTSDTVGGCGSGGGKSGCSGGGDEKDGQPHRKARRSWSPELHRRFLGALHQLGGSDVATPKRIRELMKVDSLTNDEVKSHLQKYRLHSRRPSTTSHANAGSSPPHQVVFVGGIWVPPPEYAAAAAAAAVAAARPPSEGIPAGPPSAIYAPIATVPAPKQRQQQQVKQPQRSPAGGDVRCVAGEGATTRSHSPATSSSSRTTTSSPVRRR